MKILLIKPPSSKMQLSGDAFYLVEPLELEYVAAGVSDKYDVRILDMRLDQSLEKHIAEYAPDIVGLTGFTPQVYVTKNLCQRIKTLNPEILTVIGGHHATMAPEDFCDPAVDIIVRGEGVFTFREIVERFEKHQDVYDVKGIAFYHDKGLKFTEPKEYPILDSFPLPNRSITEDCRQNYFMATINEQLKPLATLRTSRGCPYKCKFCAVWKVTNGRYLSRDPHKILEELKTLKEFYVDFVDDETFIDIKRISKLADLIDESGIKKSFSSYARADTVINNPDLFKKWGKIGLERVTLGLESNRPKDLEYFRKKSTTDINEKAVSILSKMGIKVTVSFIIPPDYDLEDFDNLANYAQDLDVELVLCMPLTPLPGTDLYDELKDQLTTTNLELFDLSHAVLPTKLPLQKFYRELAYLYLRVNKKRWAPLKEAMAEKYDQAQLQGFMKIGSELKYRHLHHQAQQ